MDNMDEIVEQEGRLQDELPLEVRLKYLSEAYHKNEKRLLRLKKYAQGLEEENVALQKKVNELEKWIDGHCYSDDYLNKLSAKFKEMQSHIKKTYPKRVVDVKVMKNKIYQQRDYIIKLITLLNKNGIEYPELKFDSLALESGYDLESIDDFAVRGAKEDFDGDPLDVKIPTCR